MHLDIVQSDILLQSSVSVSQREQEDAEGELAEETGDGDLNPDVERSVARVRVLQPVYHLEGRLHAELGQCDHGCNQRVVDSLENLNVLVHGKRVDQEGHDYCRAKISQ